MTEIHVVIVEDGEVMARQAMIWPEGADGANLTTSYRADGEEEVRQEYFSLDIHRNTIKSAI